MDSAPIHRPTLSDDLLNSVAAIADFLGWSERRVYQVRETAGAGCPIRKRPGLGIYAFKSELEAWLKAPETLPGEAADRRAEAIRSGPLLDGGAGAA